jgi:hypothetical protein
MPPENGQASVPRLHHAGAAGVDTLYKRTGAADPDGERHPPAARPGSPSGQSGTCALDWRSDGQPLIVGSVRSFIKPLAFLFVAAQLLLAVPVVASASAAAEGPPCHEMGDMGASPESASDRQPCCPDGMDMSNCLASCAMGAAVAAHVPVLLIKAERIEAQSLPPASIAVASPPPLKPPPIV